MVVLVFFGFLWNVNNFVGDVFFNFFLMSIVEIVGFFLCIFFLDCVGRKLVYVVFFFMGGFVLLLIMVFVLLGFCGKIFY